MLISGRGSNLRALIKACGDSAYPAEIVLVISSDAEAPGLKFAAGAGIRCAVVPHLDRHRFAVEAEELLRQEQVEFTCLAGFMRILEQGFVEAWQNRMINIHPSLLPAFPGLHAQRQAVTAGVRFSGCTVHFVRPELDSGPIIGQAVVPVHPGDDEQRLAARILAVEHRLYPIALRLIAEGRVTVVAERVEIEGCQVPDIAALNPAGALPNPFASANR